MKQIFSTLFCTMLAGMLMAATPAKKSEAITLHAHRGGTGLMPENTIPAMLNGIKCGADYLEMDLLFSKDRKIVVSHDIYMNAAFVTKPDGQRVSKEEHKKIRINSMTYDSIAKYDVGSADYPKFPQQKKIKVSKPLFTTLIDSVELYAKQHKLKTPHYNIEIKNSWKKSKTADAEYIPDIEEAARQIVAMVKAKGIEDRCILQTFEADMVTVLHKLYPNLKAKLGYLTSNPDFDADIQKIGFVPDFYNVDFKKVNADLVSKVHKSGAKIVTWTVDIPEDMQSMLSLGVDGIITDYPNVGRGIVDQFNKNKK